MRSFARLAALRVGLCAAALGTTSCDDPVTSPSDDLRVVTSVQPAEFRAGTKVTITLAVTNVGSRPRPLFDSCEDPFTLTTADGTAVPPAERFCALLAIAPLPVEVAPGQQLVFTRTWYGDVGLAERWSGRAAPPGEYRLRGFVRSPARRGRSGQYDLVAAYAEPVVVRVLP